MIITAPMITKQRAITRSAKRSGASFFREGFDRSEVFGAGKEEPPVEDGETAIDELLKLLGEFRFIRKVSATNFKRFSAVVRRMTILA
jgi:hypothetical protein